MLGDLLLGQTEDADPADPQIREAGQVHRPLLLDAFQPGACPGKAAWSTKSEATSSPARSTCCWLKIVSTYVRMIALLSSGDMEHLPGSVVPAGQRALGPAGMVGTSGGSAPPPPWASTL